ncbi:MAG: hypothetical protein R3C42_01040 [Parvularculaceae bacterium]|nr:hypothetical protein [Parvularculaceae bacterium]
MSAPLNRRRVRLAPVIMTAAFALASLKAAGLWIGFSAAEAEDAVVAEVAADAAAPAPQIPASLTQERLLEQLAARKAELDAREAQLDTRESVLEAAELRLESAIKSVQEEKAAIASAENNRVRAKQGEIGALANAYERMKPREAARIFEILDDDILIPVAAGMRMQSLAGVLAEMAPEKARALTVALANRAAQTPAAENAVEGETP